MKLKLPRSRRNSDIIHLTGDTLLVGDIHGNPVDILSYRNSVLSMKRPIHNIILLGDIGFGFLHQKYRGKMSKTLSIIDAIGNTEGIEDLVIASLEKSTKQSAKILINDIMCAAKLLTGNSKVKVFAIRGNHDDPRYWIPDTQLQKDIRKNNKNFYFLEDGFIDINNNLWLTVGGSVSIDRFTAQRIPGVSWWSGEEMKNFDSPLPVGYKKLTGILSHSGKTPDYASYKLPQCSEGEVAEALDRELKTIESLAVRYNPEFWIYGHFHKSWIRTLAGEMLFFCLGEHEVTPLLVPELRKLLNASKNA